jgi:hypothetical protein
MVNDLVTVVRSLSTYSSNSFFVFMPFLVIARLLFASYNMESSKNLIESLQGLISVILFVSLFKMFYPTLVETGLAEVLFSNINIDTPWFSNLLMFTVGQIAGYLAVIVKTLNISIIFLCLCLVAFSLPISFSVNRIYNFTYLWLFNKTILVGVFCWLIIMYLFNFIGDLGQVTQISSVSSLTLEILKHFISLFIFGVAIKIQLNYTPTGNSLDNVQNKILSTISPSKFQDNIKAGLSSGKFVINEQGIATDNFTSGYYNRKATEDFRDKDLSDFIKKSGLKSVAEAEKQLKSPKTFSAISSNISKEKNALNKTIFEKGLTNVSDAQMIIENPEAFNIISKNKKNEVQNDDKAMSSLILQGKATTISEAKNQIRYQDTSQSIQRINSRKNTAILNSLKNNSFESLGEAKLFVENKPAFDQIQENKSLNLSKTDSNINDIISRGKATNIPEAKQRILYPKSFESQKWALIDESQFQDKLYSKIIREKNVDSIGEAKNYVEMPRSWVSTKQKQTRNKTF